MTEPPTPVPSLDADTVRVLHVDDDPDLTDLASAVLERESDRIDVVTATTASEGLDALAATSVDCVVSDYEIPGMDGIEFLRTVREEYPDLPFILFTGQGSETIASDAISAGVTDYLQKGGGAETFELLANRVNNAVEKRWSQQARHRQLAAIESAQEGISILDESAQFIYVNEAFIDLFGYDREELLGSHWNAIYPDDEAAFVRENVVPRAEERGTWHGETIGQQADGTTFVVNHTLSVTERGELICTVRDVTDRKEREQELTRKTRAIDEAPIGIVMTDPRRTDNPIVYVNDYFEDLTGYSASEAVGRNCRFLQGEATDPEPVERMREAIDAEESVQVDVRNYRKDGTEFWNRVTIAPIVGDAGHVISFVGFQQDVTPQRKRVENLERYQRMVDTMGEFACLYDEDGRFEIVNQALADFYDTVPAALEGERSALIPKIREESDGDPYGDMVAGDRTELHGEIEADFPGHGHAALAYRLVRLTRDEEFRGVVGVGRDVTERVERERELRRENERLDEFARIVSHDLRNPLHVAEGYVDLARENVDSPYLDEVSRVHAEMEELIDDLLALARSGDAVTDLEPVDVGQLARNCWQHIGTPESTLATDTNRAVRADPTRLQQLVENLLGNAVTHGGNDVTVTVGSFEDGFYVADDGPGVPESDRTAIFESGYSTRDEGTGFGLSIVTEIADAHGWTVTVSESEMGGARFEVTGVEFA